MFSEMMRMRPARAQARSCDGQRLQKIQRYPPPDQYSAFAKRGLDEIQASRVERGRRLKIHLVGGHLHHLFFQVHGVAGRPHFERARISVLERRLAQADSLDVSSIGARQRNGGDPAGSGERSWPRSRPERAAVLAISQGVYAVSSELEYRQRPSPASRKHPQQ